MSYFAGLAICTVLFGADAKPDPYLTVEYVIGCFQAVSVEEVTIERMRRYKEAYYPIYSKLLNDSKTDPKVLFRVLGVLRMLESDTKQFTPVAKRLLLHDTHQVRTGAIHFLYEHPSPSDAVLFLPLLSDSDRSVVIAAATVLSRTGDKQALLAFDIWIKLDVHRDDKKLTAQIRVLRDAMAKRLDSKQ